MTPVSDSFSYGRPEEPDPELTADEAIVESAFGAENRATLLERYFTTLASALSPVSAWEHVYRLLLWTDKGTGLAHCYESDKSQPGKNWYARSLAFHAWVASALGVAPAELDREIDWLFTQAAQQLAAETRTRAEVRAAAAARQRAPYEGRGLPSRGRDPLLEHIIYDALREYMLVSPPQHVSESLEQGIREHVALENKRRNLLGEGFEDVVATILRRLPGTAGITTQTRALLHELPGFNRTRRGEKANKVDIALLGTPSGRRTLVTSKWSIRADREKQFAADFQDYLNAEADREPFDYVLVTNEFDPARLKRACEHIHGNALMFSSVVHISTDAVRATYAGAGGRRRRGDSMDVVMNHINDGRLLDLGAWVSTLGLR